MVTVRTLRSVRLIRRLRITLGGGVGGSVPVATPHSVHSTYIELQLLMPQHHVHIFPRPLLRLRLRPRLRPGPNHITLTLRCALPLPLKLDLRLGLGLGLRLGLRLRLRGGIESAPCSPWESRGRYRLR